MYTHPTPPKEMILSNNMDASPLPIVGIVAAVQYHSIVENKTI